MALRKRQVDLQKCPSWFVSDNCIVNYYAGAKRAVVKAGKNDKGRHIIWSRVCGYPCATMNRFEMLCLCFGKCQSLGGSR